jgi:hypothetical protein
VKHRAGRGDLRQPALDRRVDVLIACVKRELAAIELTPDPAQAALDRRQLAAGDEPRRGQAARMRDAARDVEGVELVVELER